MEYTVMQVIRDTIVHLWGRVTMSLLDDLINYELCFPGLTELEDEGAESLSTIKYDLNIDLDKLPESAAQILRDAGHG